MHHQSCKQENKSLLIVCGQCGAQKDAHDILDALQTILDAANRGAVTVGDCNQAQRAIDQFKAA